MDGLKIAKTDENCEKERGSNGRMGSKRETYVKNAKICENHSSPPSKTSVFLRAALYPYKVVQVRPVGAVLAYEAGSDGLPGWTCEYDVVNYFLWVVAAWSVAFPIL